MFFGHFMRTLFSTFLCNTGSIYFLCIDLYREGILNASSSCTSQVPRPSCVLLLGKYLTLLYNVFLAGIELDTVLTVYCATLRLRKPYQVRRVGNTKCSFPVCYQHVVQTNFSLFCPFSTTVSLHGWFPAWFGSLCSLDFVENICNLASAAVP